MHRIAVLVTFILLMTSTLSFGRGVGTSAMNFLKTTHGPRFDAMAGAGVAAVDDLNSISWNPAGLSKLTPDYLDVSFEHDFYFGQVEYEVLNFGQYLGDTYGFGGQVLYRHMPDIDNDLEDEIPQKAWDLAGTLGFGMKVSDFAVGLNAKYLHSQLGSETLSGIAADLGMMVHFLEEKLVVALGVQNLGPDILSDSLPLYIRVGAAYRESYGLKKEHDLLGVLEINQPLDNTMRLKLGFEYLYTKTFAVRLGYDQQIGGNDLQSDSFLDRLTFGTGIRWADLQLDYAYIPFADLGSSHKVSLKLHYGPLTDVVENF